MKKADPTSPIPAVEAIRRSWERCAANGLRNNEHLPDGILPRASLADRLEGNARLVAYVQPIMEHLHQQIARSSSTILLADDAGMILRAVGDADFAERAARVALQPGVSWAECTMGTNAIGTALAEQRPMAVIGTDHFLERNRFLTCVATRPYGMPEDHLRSRMRALGLVDGDADTELRRLIGQGWLSALAEELKVGTNHAFFTQELGQR